MKNQDRLDDKTNAIPAALLKGLVRLVILMVVMSAVFFLSAGRLNWWEAWAYIGQALFVLIFGRVILIVKHLDTAMERAEAAQKEGIQPWDKILMPLNALYLPFLSWVVAGLDKRFGWSPDLPDYIQLIALALLFLGSMFGNWAMLANRFFSSHVRIQTDRDHRVVSSGPYRIVRHPGYAGSVLSWIAAPVLFSSYWLVIPAILGIAAGAMRTALEDRFLQEKLSGYKEYASQVRYRLIPGIW